jgi:hypothetical protein
MIKKTPGYIARLKKQKAERQLLPYDAEKSTRMAWRNMLMRCYHVAHVSFAEYGGRGIKVHEEWVPSSLRFGTITLKASFVFQDTKAEDFEEAYQSFLKYMGLKPAKAMSLDRAPNPDGNYEPGNVRWATPQQQGITKRIPPKYVPGQDGAPILAVDACKALGVSYQTLRGRLVANGTWDKYPRGFRPAPK